MIWAAKIAVKVLLSQFPAGYGFWQKLGLFRHGAMDSVEYCCRVAESHIKRYRDVATNASFVALELGPGDSVGSALVANCFGASKTYLVDSGHFATTDMRVYGAVIDHLSARGAATSLDIVKAGDFAGMLRSCGGVYLTSGLESLRTIPSESVDLIWSHAVLEHVARDEFVATLSELRRVLKPTGVASHRIDLKDHLGGALNNLRFSERVWESRLFRSSGFYTNRIRYSEMLRLFRDANFATDVVNVNRWSVLPIRRERLAAAYRSLSDDDLRVSGFDVLLRPSH